MPTKLTLTDPAIRQQIEASPLILSRNGAGAQDEISAAELLELLPTMRKATLLEDGRLWLELPRGALNWYEVDPAP